MPENPQAFTSGGFWHRFECEAEGFSGISGMTENHDRYLRGLNRWVLGKEVGSF